MHPIRPPQRARNDLEAFADEWKGLKERKQYIELEEAQVVDLADELLCRHQAGSRSKNTLLFSGGIDE
jgi:hypothetical protein